MQDAASHRRRPQLSMTGNQKSMTRTGSDRMKDFDHSRGRRYAVCFSSSSSLPWRSSACTKGEMRICFVCFRTYVFGNEIPRTVHSTHRTNRTYRGHSTVHTVHTVYRDEGVCSCFRSLVVVAQQAKCMHDRIWRAQQAQMVRYSTADGRQVQHSTTMRWAIGLRQYSK